MGYADIFPQLMAGVSQADLALARALRDWGETELSSKRLEYQEDYEQLLKPAMRKLFCDIGMQKILWPEQYDGGGQATPDLALTLAVALEEIGRADTGIACLLAVNYALGGAVAMSASPPEALADKLARDYCQSGEVVIGSLVLPALGGKAQGSLGDYRGKTVPLAKPEGEGWLVDAAGLRPLISGADADFFCVPCSTGNGDSPLLLLVPGDAAGLKRGKPFLKTGLAASRNADINLHNVKFTAAQVVLRGETAWRGLLSWLTLGMSAACTGALFSTYEIIKEWGDTRVIKGRQCIFKENPLTASLMAEIGTSVLTSRLLTYSLAQMLAEPAVHGEAGSEKNWATATAVFNRVSSAAEQAIDNTMELMASAGYAKEWQLERYWRDVKTIAVSMGNRELNKMDLARYFYETKTL
jgi:alkylation response protein AidB-like acyl-CoA dehydrogenase